VVRQSLAVQPLRGHHWELCGSDAWDAVQPDADLEDHPVGAVRQNRGHHWDDDQKLDDRAAALPEERVQKVSVQPLEPVAVPYTRGADRFAA
jgi:hypothetical protein